MNRLKAKNGKQWPGPFQAVQWTGDVFLMRDILRPGETIEQLNRATGDNPVLVVKEPDNKYFLELTDWLIRDGGGILRQGSDDDVRALYTIEGDAP